jgi:cyclopropane-fatty-acyl-phospholipid synthase
MNALTNTVIKNRECAWFHGFLRGMITRKLSGMTYGSLRITDGSETFNLGTSRAGEPSASISVHRATMWERLAFGGTIGAAESYMDEDWSTDNLVAVVRIFAGNREMMGNMEGGLAWLRWPALKLWHFARRDTINQAKKNISAHYDLGNRFFELWLDSSMTYSSGLFNEPGVTLFSASMRKVSKLCERLDLKPGMRLLEIGSGWGAMAIHAASNYGCKVTTATISRNQFDFVTREVRRLGLEHLITPIFEDYRNLKGKYDRVVSVEMIEAVGHEFIDTYFEKISGLLTDDGAAVIQAITIRDQYYDNAVRNVDFIQRYIFPGSTIPSVSKMLNSVRDRTDMVLDEMEDFTAHYARTLSCWRERFWNASSELQELGMNMSSLRMWDFYFAYCQGGFTERAIGVCQFKLTKPGYRSAKFNEVKPC